MYQENFYSFISSYLLSEIEVGTHLYWEVLGLKVHGQTILMSWFVISILLVFAVVGTRNLKQVPQGIQNFMEYAYEFLQDIAKNQIGEHNYRPWVPYVSTVFLFIFVSNWSGALIPLKLIHLPSGELAAPTNDINTTVALALLTSLSYFYGGISKKGLNPLSAIEAASNTQNIKSLFGEITRHHKSFKYHYSEYWNDFQQKKIVHPIVKIWTGR